MNEMDFAILALLIMVPAVFVIALFWSQHYEIDESGNKRLKPVTTLFELNAMTGASNQKLLWMSIVIPFLYFLEFGFLAWWGSTPDYSAKGFVEFLRISSLPLGLLSLCLPLSLLVLRLHSTKQTAEQINITRVKNNADAFYAHRKAMIEYFALFPEKKYTGELIGRFEAHPSLHMHFFSTSSTQRGVEPINNEKKNSCIQLLNEIKENLMAFMNVNNDIAVRKGALIKACDYVYVLGDMLFLSIISEQIKSGSSSRVVLGLPGNSNNKTITFVGKTRLSLIAAFFYEIDYVEILFNFSGIPYDFSRLRDMPFHIKNDYVHASRPYYGDYKTVIEHLDSESAVTSKIREEEERRAPSAV
ncbi:hypothetical protein ALO97_03663 [Pseudomonas syringae pv. tagetis]|uniref:Uncharacterized protein n=2 Tax=Pseudomonas syringae pv. tagetis TaxID=129140 RepID=A0A0Q0CA17_9PSED|nr:Uncharacterized protein ALO44_02851 [Pseudomonas syringae pv. tagetis]RMW17656.1 hypothetical protein ALO98_03172 [Pseudomonas syringae pv. tagetis]RMW24853.1 hypothetical protein ALO97_03663 [Pseudomonas syringae pv. tagetis]